VDQFYAAIWSVFTLRLTGEGEEAENPAREGEEDRGRLYINETQYFDPLPKDVWEFHIGGYQVIDKYLKSRKGRKLSLDEINHIGAMADSLAFTITQMAAIDIAFVAAFD